ncbi:MAG: tetraacyldisaccharide 4'-kinase [Elusimicrobiota bacterium]
MRQNTLHEMYFNLINKHSKLNPLNLFLYILSTIYCAVIVLRRKFNLKASLITIKQPVISVGNLTTGGTGKTPVVIKIAEAFSTRKLTAVLTRGYKRKTSMPIIVDQDDIPETDAVGDEPYLIKQRIPGIILGVSKNRAHIAQEISNAELFILDDGFQYLKIKKDLNIILIDALNPFGNEYCLPRGILREPVSSLKYADIIIVTKSNMINQGRLDDILNRLKSLFSGHVFTSEYAPTCLKSFNDFSEVLPLTFLTKKNTVLISALANPYSFEKTVSALGANIIENIVFPDHHSYTEKDVNKINNFKKDTIRLTTEKDAVKLISFQKLLQDTPLYILQMDTLMPEALEYITANYNS